MLTKLIIRNFKRFDEVVIDLASPVVFVGPNNSGKTTALQALSLWDVAARKWSEKRAAGQIDNRRERRGFALNRRDFLYSPVPTTKHLWRDLHVRRGTRLGDKPATSNIRLDVGVEGFGPAPTLGSAAAPAPWQCGFEFDFQNDESVAVRPLRLPGFEDAKVAEAGFTEVPENVGRLLLNYLPPMSGLASEEHVLTPGSIRSKIGEGQTAQVLRNLVYRVYDGPGQADLGTPSRWEDLCRQMHDMFGATLEAPMYRPETGKLDLSYRESERGQPLDICLAGRGFQQCLLLFAFLYSQPGSVLLLDEPDAHLELLRQDSVYRRLTRLADESGSQVIVATHSEVILNHAAQVHKVIYFPVAGPPRRIEGGERSQVRKSLASIGFECYIRAEQRGWILYLEGESDRELLIAFARLLGRHEGASILRDAYAHYLGTNVPNEARDHFFGLRMALPDLRGVAVFDRLEKKLPADSPLLERMWTRRELENYLALPDVLTRFLDDPAGTEDIFTAGRIEREKALMEEEIRKLEQSFQTLGKGSPWSHDVKVSDEALAPLFRNFYAALGEPLGVRKAGYHHLVDRMTPTEVSAEVVEMLDCIERVAAEAKPN